MTRLWPLAALLSLTVIACQGGAPPFVGKPRIAGTSIKTASSARPGDTPATSTPSSAPASSAPLPSQEPPPVPVAAAGGGGTSTTPNANASPTLALTTGTQPADTWQAGIPMQRARAGLLAAVLADKLVAFEGSNSPSVESYTAGEIGWLLDTRHDLAGRPADPDAAMRDGRSLQVLGVSGDFVYGAGGSDGLGTLDSLSRYDADGFSGEATFMASPAKAAAGGMVGDVLIVAGGLGQNGAVATSTQRLAVSVGSASLGVAMPRPVAGAASAVVGSKVYVFGGYTLDTDGAPVASAAVQVYDVGANTWRHDSDGLASAPKPLPAARHSAAAAVLGGKIYVAGGVDANGATLGTIAVYDPTANTWATKAAMATPRALLALAAYQNRLWALGGYDANGRPLASVEIYQP